MRDLNVLVGIPTDKMCRCLVIQPVCLVAETAGLVTVITKTYKNSILRAGRALEGRTTAAAAAAAGDGGDGGGGGGGDGGSGDCGDGGGDGDGGGGGDGGGDDGGDGGGGDGGGGDGGGGGGGYGGGGDGGGGDGDGGGGDGGGDGGDGGDGGGGVITVTALAGKYVRQGPGLEHTNNRIGQHSHTNRTNVLRNEGKKLLKYTEMKRV